MAKTPPSVLRHTPPRIFGGKNPRFLAKEAVLVSKKAHFSGTKSSVFWQTRTFSGKNPNFPANPHNFLGKKIDIFFLYHHFKPQNSPFFPQTKHLAAKIPIFTLAAEPKFPLFFPPMIFCPNPLNFGTKLAWIFGEKSHQNFTNLDFFRPKILSFVSQNLHFCAPKS